MNECGLSIMKSEHGDARHIPRWRRRRQWGGLALSAPPSPSQLAKGASGAAFDSRICRERDGHAKDTYEVFVSEEDLFRFDASTVGMDGEGSSKKGRGRSMNYLGIAGWNWQLPKHEPGATATLPDRQEGEGLRSERSPKRVRLQRSYLHHHHHRRPRPRRRRRRHPVLVAQEKDRRDHRRGEEAQRFYGFTSI